MTDLERVRDQLAGQGPGETWAAAIIDAHLKEDAEREELLAFRTEETEHQAERANRNDTRYTELREAVKAARPGLLADWFDQHDRKRLAQEMGVTEAEVPDYMLSGMEVQRDLRTLAGQLIEETDRD